MESLPRNGWIEICTLDAGHEPVAKRIPRRRILRGRIIRLPISCAFGRDVRALRPPVGGNCIPPGLRCRMRLTEAFDHRPHPAAACRRSPIVGRARRQRRNHLAFAGKIRPETQRLRLGERCQHRRLGYRAEKHVGIGGIVAADQFCVAAESPEAGTPESA